MKDSNPQYLEKYTYPELVSEVETAISWDFIVGTVCVQIWPGSRTKGQIEVTEAALAK
jgi:hypothetical protein